MLQKMKTLPKPTPAPTNRLIDQFYITLLASHDRIEQRNGSSGRPLSLSEVKELLEKEPKTWRTAYHVEQLLITHYGDQEMEMEMERRLVDAQELLARNVYGAYARAKCQIDAQKDPARRRAEKRTLLGRLINDLQWKYELLQAKKEYERQLTRRTAWFFIGVFILFLVYVIGATGWLLAGTDNPNATQAIAAANARVSGQPVLFYFFTVGLATLAGCLGACFSMLTGLKPRLQQSTIDDIKIMHAPSNLSTRALIGICAGLIIFYFIRSGLLTGPLVPDLIVKTNDSYDLFTAMALLVVWCFLGGFSEKLVPALLSKTEAQAGVVGSQASPPGGFNDAPFRPTRPVSVLQESIGGDGEVVAWAGAEGMPVSSPMPAGENVEGANARSTPAAPSAAPPSAGGEAPTVDDHPLDEDANQP